MPAKTNSAQGVTVEAVDAALPRTFFVMRGHIATAFGLTKEEMAALVRDGTFVAEYPIKGGRARFVRSQVLAVAKRWEGKP
jgi:hypothetical protein